MSLLFWNTNETVFISSSLEISRTSTPPILILPEFTSKNLEIRLASVDFPPPDGPTNATVCPSFIFSDISDITSF